MRFGTDQGDSTVEAFLAQRLCRRLLRDHNIAVHYLINGPKTWHISITRRRHE
jgi:hypothetical protein